MLGTEVYVRVESSGLEMGERHLLMESYECKTLYQAFHTYLRIEPSKESPYGEVVPAVRLRRLQPRKVK